MILRPSSHSWNWLKSSNGLGENKVLRCSLLNKAENEKKKELVSFFSKSSFKEKKTSFLDYAILKQGIVCASNSTQYNI